MDRYKELSDRLRGITGQRNVLIYQGTVRSVEGVTCTVCVDNINIPDVRLRASIRDSDVDVLLVPKIGSIVILGSVTGDIADLAVLAFDELDSVRISGQITVNGGQLGGLVNIHSLTDALNRFVQKYNNHTHNGNQGTPTSPPLQSSSQFDAGDYEDLKITH